MTKEELIIETTALAYYYVFAYDSDNEDIILKAFNEYFDKVKNDKTVSALTVGSAIWIFDIFEREVAHYADSSHKEFQMTRHLLQRLVSLRQNPKGNTDEDLSLYDKLADDYINTYLENDGAGIANEFGAIFEKIKDDAYISAPLVGSTAQIIQTFATHEEKIQLHSLEIYEKALEMQISLRMLLSSYLDTHDLGLDDDDLLGLELDEIRERIIKHGI